MNKLIVVGVSVFILCSVFYIGFYLGQYITLKWGIDFSLNYLNITADTDLILAGIQMYKNEAVYFARNCSIQRRVTAEQLRGLT